MTFLFLVWFVGLFFAFVRFVLVKPKGIVASAIIETFERPIFVLCLCWPIIAFDAAISGIVRWGMGR